MHLTVFDLDHTLLTVNSSFRFGAFLYKQRGYSTRTLIGCLIDYARYKWMGMSIYDLHHQTFVRLFKGRPLANIQKEVTQFLSESLTSITYLPAVHRLREAQARGDYLLILSSSPDFLVEQVARHFNVDHWKATVYESDNEGDLSGISQVMEGENKADYLKRLLIQLDLPRSAITAYSDSYLDLPLLKMAGEAIAVRPDSRLKRVCLQKGWEII